MKLSNLNHNNLSFKQGQIVRQPIVVTHKEVNGHHQHHQMVGDQQVLTASEQQDRKILSAIASRVIDLQRRSDDPISAMAEIGFTPTFNESPDLNPHYARSPRETCREQSTMFTINANGEKPITVQTNQLVVGDVYDKAKIRPVGDISIAVNLPPLSNQINPHTTKYVQQYYTAHIASGTSAPSSSGYLPEIGGVLTKFSTNYAKAYNQYANSLPDDIPTLEDTLSFVTETIEPPMTELSNNTGLLNKCWSQPTVSPAGDARRQAGLLTQQQKLEQQYGDWKPSYSNALTKYPKPKLDR